MAARPAIVRFEIGGIRVAVLHGGMAANNQFVFASTPAAEKITQAEALGADLVIAGHSGIPFTQPVGDRLWHNAGVIGMPANDGTPDTWFSIVESSGDGIAVSHRRLAYDFAGAARDMRANGFPEAYARALETGLWPSLDILPETERRQTGVALAPAGGVIGRSAPDQSPATKKCQVPSGPIPSL